MLIKFFGGPVSWETVLLDRSPAFLQTLGLMTPLENVIKAYIFTFYLFYINTSLLKFNEFEE